MTALLASTSATASTATEGDVKTYLANLREFIADLLGTDSTNKAAVHGLLGSLLNGKLVKTGAYTVGAADRGKVIDCTGTWVLSLAAAATLGDGFCFALKNSGSGAITIDPNLTEQINGLSTKVLTSGEFLIVYCDGSSFYSVGGASFPAGFISAYAGSAPPIGWLFCYGQAVSRSVYSVLFSAIGTIYGAGDGATTFNLPDLRGRAIAGKDDMGGGNAGRMTNIAASTTLGASGNEGNTAVLSSPPGYTLMYSQPVFISNYVIKT